MYTDTPWDDGPQFTWRITLLRFSVEPLRLTFHCREVGESIRRGKFFSWWDRDLKKECSPLYGCPICAESNWLPITVYWPLPRGRVGAGQPQGQEKMLILISGHTVPFCDIPFGSAAETVWIMDKPQPLSWVLSKPVHYKVYISCEHSRVTFSPDCIM